MASLYGQPVDPLHLRVLKDGTLTFVLPAPKGAPAPPATTDRPANQFGRPPQAVPGIPDGPANKLPPQGQPGFPGGTTPPYPPGSLVPPPPTPAPRPGQP